jgi:hypothetical protein
MTLGPFQNLGFCQPNQTHDKLGVLVKSAQEQNDLNRQKRAPQIASSASVLGFAPILMD